MSAADWPRDNENNIVGYFWFEEDQDERTLDGEDSLQFMTSPYRDDCFDRHSPSDVKARLEQLLHPIFLDDLDIDASESLHMITNCNPEDHAKTTGKIRSVLVQNGWTEV